MSAHSSISSMQALEWLELSFKRGYRDGYDEQPAITRLRLARLHIGPVFGKDDADCLIAVYRLGFSVGDEQRVADVAAEAAKAESIAWV